MIKCDLNLESYIESFNRKKETIPAHIKRSLYTQLVTAMNSCMACSLFHRDIKTQNILLKFADNDSIVLYVSDFGES